MKLSPLRLRSYGISDTSVRANTEFDPKTTGDEAAAQIKAQVVRSRRAGGEDGRDWKVDLIVSVEETQKNSPYFVRVAATGFFEVSKDLDDPAAERIVAVNAPSLLFGAIRELVALVTGRGPFKSFILPSVSFIDEVDRPTVEQKTAPQVEPGN